MSASPRIGVGLCGELEQETGLELAAVAEALEEVFSNVRVEVVPGLCRSPDHVPPLASRTGATRMALGLCAPSTRGDEFQAWARRVGLDPFALELVDLEGAESSKVAVRVLTGALARLTAFPGSTPEQVKLRLTSFEQRRTRRSLLTLPPTTYAPVAHIEEESCLGRRRCGLCVEVCPFSAIGPIGGRLAVDRERCESCGACVPSCPTRAIGLPSSTLSEYEAEIAVLLAAESPSLLFTCRRAAVNHAAGNGLAPLSAGWLPVTVPCLGIVTPGWILQALARGASAVALLGCGDGCFSRSSAVRDRVSFIREVLQLLGAGAASERVAVLSAGSDLPRVGPRQPAMHELGWRVLDGELSLLEPGATTEAVVALAERSNAIGVSLAHTGSPLGLVSLREETCTACGACPTVCPTEALLGEQGARGESIITFDAGRCVACGNCVRVCPEQALETLSVRAGIDVLALTHGRAVLKRARSASCRRCGGPIAPDAMLNRIRTLLETDDSSGPLIATLTQLCSDCRALDSAL